MHPSNIRSIWSPQSSHHKILPLFYPAPDPPGYHRGPWCCTWDTSSGNNHSTRLRNIREEQLLDMDTRQAEEWTLIWGYRRSQSSSEQHQASITVSPDDLWSQLKEKETGKVLLKKCPLKMMNFKKKSFDSRKDKPQLSRFIFLTLRMPR